MSELIYKEESYKLRCSQTFNYLNHAIKPLKPPVSPMARKTKK